MHQVIPNSHLALQSDQEKAYRERLDFDFEFISRFGSIGRRRPRKIGFSRATASSSHPLAELDGLAVYARTFGLLATIEPLGTPSPPSIEWHPNDHVENVWSNPEYVEQMLWDKYRGTWCVLQTRNWLPDEASASAAAADFLGCAISFTSTVIAPMRFRVPLLGAETIVFDRDCRSCPIDGATNTLQSTARLGFESRLTTSRTRNGRVRLSLDAFAGGPLKTSTGEFRRRVHTADARHLRKLDPRTAPEFTSHVARTLLSGVLRLGSDGIKPDMAEHSQMMRVAEIALVRDRVFLAHSPRCSTGRIEPL